jgi:hypothetical protein
MLIVRIVIARTKAIIIRFKAHIIHVVGSNQPATPVKYATS